MRDIRPVRRSKRSSPGQPLPARPRRRPPSGTAVPVTKVHLPAREAAGPERPLFAPKPLATRQQKTTASKMRVGGKERQILAGFLALVVLALVLAGLIFLPRAQIRLILRTAPLLVDEHLTIRAQDTNGENIIPGTAFFREIQVEGTSPVTSMEVVGTKATGTVQIINRTLQEQKVKENSRLVTKDGQLFYMKTHAIVPPSGQVSVPVEAAEAGEGGNIAPQHLNFAALDSAAQQVVYAEAGQKFTGGSGQKVRLIKDEDLNQAKKNAESEAKSKAEQEIRNELPKGWVILDESWTTESQAFETTAKVGDKTDTIPYKARVIVRVLGYEEGKLEEHLKAALEAHLDKEYMLFPGPISFTKSLVKIDWEKAEGEIAVRVTHTTIPKFSLDTLRGKVSGRSKTETMTYLEGLPGIQSVDINLWPFWVNSIPRIEKRIAIDIEPERKP